MRELPEYFVEINGKTKIFNSFNQISDKIAELNEKT